MGPKGNWPSYGFRLAANLKAFREMRGLSQSRLALLAGLSRNLVSNLERNENTADSPADPKLSTIYKLARALCIPPAVLMPAADREVSKICRVRGTAAEIAVIWPGEADDTARFSRRYLKSAEYGQAPEFETEAD